MSTTPKPIRKRPEPLQPPAPPACVPPHDPLRETADLRGGPFSAAGLGQHAPSTATGAVPRVGRVARWVGFLVTQTPQKKQGHVVRKGLCQVLLVEGLR